MPVRRPRAQPSGMEMRTVRRSERTVAVAFPSSFPEVRLTFFGSSLAEECLAFPPVEGVRGTFGADWASVSLGEAGSTGFAEESCGAWAGGVGVGGTIFSASAAGVWGVGVSLIVSIVSHIGCTARVQRRGR